MKGLLVWCITEGYAVEHVLTKRALAAEACRPYQAVRAARLVLLPEGPPSLRLSAEEWRRLFGRNTARSAKRAKSQRAKGPNRKGGAERPRGGEPVAHVR